MIWLCKYGNFALGSGKFKTVTGLYPSQLPQGICIQHSKRVKQSPVMSLFTGTLGGFPKSDMWTAMTVLSSATFTPVERFDRALNSNGTVRYFHSNYTEMMNQVEFELFQGTLPSAHAQCAT